MRAVGGRRDRDDRRQRGGDRLRLDRALGGLRWRWRTASASSRVLQHEPHDVGPVVLGAELRRGEEIGLLIPAAIDVPADQILAAGRGHVIAGRRPGDPFAALRLDEQREQLLRRPLQRSQRIVPSP